MDTQSEKDLTWQVAMTHVGGVTSSTKTNKSSFRGGRPFEFQGGEPKFSYVGRTVDVSKNLFEEFKVRSKGRRSSGLFTAFLQPRATGEDVEGMDNMPRARRHHSIFGLRVVSPYNISASIWSMFITSLDATYTAFLVPILLAFMGGANLDTKITDWFVMLEVIAGLAFALDIFINFHIGFIVKYDFKKKIVMDGKSVLWYYAVHGGLWIDILSVLPLLFEVAVRVAAKRADVAHISAMLRIFRLVRLTRLMRNLYFAVFAGSIKKNPIFQKIPMALVYFMSVVYTIAFMVNLLGCLLYIAARLERTTGNYFDGTWLQGHNGTDTENHITSIYWAVTTITTVGYGDITPKTSAEKVLVTILMLTHIMLFGLLVGSMSELVKSSTKRARAAEQYKSKIGDVGEWLQSRKVPHSMAKKVHAYYAELSLQNSGFDEASIFTELPMNLRSEIAFNITKDMLNSLSYFKEVDDKALAQLAGRLMPVHLPPGHELFREGDPAESIFIIGEGTVFLLQNEEQVERLCGPVTCGESAILAAEIPEFSIRPVTLRAFTSCHMWELKVKDIEPLFISNPGLRNELTEGYRKRMLQVLDRKSLPVNALENKLEAELGMDVTAPEAQAFMNRIGMTSTMDGTFPKLVKDTFRRNRAQTMKMRKTSSDLEDTGSASPFSPLCQSSPWDMNGVLECVRERLMEQGTNGMLDLIQKLKQYSNPEGNIGLTDFQACMDYLKLSSRQMLGLFAFLDPLDSGTVQMKKFITLLRAPTMQQHSTIEFLRAVFQYLDKNRTGGMDIIQLVTGYHVEYHRDVVNGKLSRGDMLTAVVLAFKDSDQVEFMDFIQFNMDLEMCMEDKSGFKQMVLDTWGIPNPGALYFDMQE